MAPDRNEFDDELKRFGAPPVNGSSDLAPDDEPLDPDVATDGTSDDAVAEHEHGEDAFPDEAPADEETADDLRRTALPPKFEAWRKRSATGAILTGFALGLQQAFGKEQEQPSIVMETSGDPPRDLPVSAEVERARPRQSVVSIRPWLLSGTVSTAAAADPDADPGPVPARDPEPEDG